MVEAWLIAPLMAEVSILAGYYIHDFVKIQDVGTYQDFYSENIRENNS
jgi:hypothetical protein